MKKVLLIEDNTSLREEIALILRLEDYEVIEAKNGNSGLLLTFTLIPDLIICDIFMGKGIDGFEVLREIRNNNSTKNIPFIFITGASEKTSQLYAGKLGADDYLIKPFEPEILLKTIKLQLEQRTNSIIIIDLLKIPE